MSAKVVPIEHGGNRRVITFMNLGLGGKWAAPSTLQAGVQLLLAGETASGHQTSTQEFRPLIPSMLQPDAFGIRR